MSKRWFSPGPHVVTSCHRGLFMLTNSNIYETFDMWKFQISLQRKSPTTWRLCLTSSTNCPNRFKSLSYQRWVKTKLLQAVTAGSFPVSSFKELHNYHQSALMWGFYPRPASVSAVGGPVMSRPGRPAVHLVLPGARPRQPTSSTHTAARGFGQQAAGPHI